MRAYLLKEEFHLFWEYLPQHGPRSSRTSGARKRPLAHRTDQKNCTDDPLAQTSHPQLVRSAWTALSRCRGKVSIINSKRVSENRTAFEPQEPLKSCCIINLAEPPTPTRSSPTDSAEEPISLGPYWASRFCASASLRPSGDDPSFFSTSDRGRDFKSSFASGFDPGLDSGSLGLVSIGFHTTPPVFAMSQFS